MFGLMKPVRSCGQQCHDSLDYKQFRMHYCGTCKTIGHHYGHKARMVLNFDAVFLSELLSKLSEQNLTTWEDSLQAYNRCFTMPDGENSLPISLQYAAAANVLLAELKIDDNIRDRASKRYRVARWLLSKSFKRAAAQLEAWGVATDEFWQCVDLQNVRETSMQREFESVEACLDFYAEPTARMTARIFEQGANVAERTDQAAAMYALGWQFGRLMYVLDAFEDVERDLARGQFNPLALYYGATETLSESEFEALRMQIQGIESTIYDLFKTLDLSPETQDLYASRLSSNLAMRIFRDRTIPRTWRQRVAMRWERAKQTADNIVCQPTTWGQQVKYYMVSFAVFVTPQASQHLENSAKGQIVGWVAIFTAMMAGIGLGRQAWAASQTPPLKQKRSLWQRFKGIFRRKRNAADPCLSECCSLCCECCFDSSCQLCCQTCCDDDGCCNCANWDKGDWKAFLFAMMLLIVVIALIWVFVVFL